jgi:hypothetical protein
VPTEVRVVYVDVLPKPPEAIPPTPDDLDRLDSAFRAADWIDSSDDRYERPPRTEGAQFVLPIAPTVTLSFKDIRTRIEAIGGDVVPHLLLQPYRQEGESVEWGEWAKL